MEGKKTKSEVTTLAQNPLLQSQEKDPRAVFTLREKLGEGSYGSVWRATYKQTGEDYAIKRVGIDNDLADLQVEITFMRSCDSEYIVRYFQSYVLGTELWIVMDYCCAGSVSDLMKATDTTLNVPQMQLVTRCALRGLEYLHAMHKIHRDIKCGNILLNAHGIGKLADFGVSGQLCDTMAKRHTFIGSVCNPFFKGTQTPCQCPIHDCFFFLFLFLFLFFAHSRSGWRQRSSRRLGTTRRPTSGRWASRSSRWPRAGRRTRTSTRCARSS